MDIAEIRRLRLKQWFADRTLPEKEKSYLSQLIHGKASFGERAARRLERDYGMGPKFLDKLSDAEIQTDAESASPIHSREYAIVNLIASLSKEDQNKLIRALEKKLYYEKRIEGILASKEEPFNLQVKPQPEIDSEPWKIEGVVGDLSDLRSQRVKKSKKAG